MTVESKSTILRRRFMAGRMAEYKLVRKEVCRDSTNPNLDPRLARGAVPAVSQAGLVHGERCGGVLHAGGIRQAGAQRGVDAPGGQREARSVKRGGWIRKPVKSLVSFKLDNA